jgi:type VI secretion system protein ImpA
VHTLIQDGEKGDYFCWFFCGDSMELMHWLAAVSEDMPCGVDLEYDPEFLEFIEALKGKPEQQFGEKLYAATAPDWRDVERRGEALSLRTRDLRVVAGVARAWLNLHGVTGLRDGVELVSQLCSQYWDQVFPQLVIDGETDPYLRCYAIAALADTESMGHELRAATAVNSKLGPISLGDVEKILDGQASEGGITREQIVIALGDASRAKDPILTALRELPERMQTLRALVAERTETQLAPDFESMQALIKAVVRLIPPTSAAAADTAAISEAGGTEGDPQAPVRATPPGTIRNRQDAIEALERVCTYLESAEPTSPAPLLIRRAQRLMTMNFFDLMRDLAPDSLSQIKTITGPTEG